MIAIFNNIKNKFTSYLRIYFLYPVKYPTSIFLSICPKIVHKSNETQISKGVVFHDWDVINKFGNNIYIGKNTYIDNCSEIGSFCSISMGVKIGLKNHKLNLVSTSPFFYNPLKSWGVKKEMLKVKSVRIEADVLVSANSIIVEGVKLGVGSVVGAGSVVNKDVPPYAIVGGVPAKILKYRFPEDQIELLLTSKWWELSAKEIVRLKDYFEDPVVFVSKVSEINNC